MVVQDMLRAWGLGKAMNTPPNGYKVGSLARLIRNPGSAGARAPSMSDDDHQRVDRIVTAMKFSKQTHHRVIVLSYVDGKKDAEIGKVFRASRSWARETRVAAEHWIEAKLEP